ncbi:MAG: hypothetical protein EXS37_07565 [Opitutus sp.]|nr:hypothetical protein [Opitutus sp.]
MSSWLRLQNLDGRQPDGHTAVGASAARTTPRMNLTPSKLIRRTHMYLALFLSPWMIIYALSGLALNHGDIVRGFYGGKFNDFEKIGEQPYTAAFSEGADARAIGTQILSDLGLAGSFNVQPGATPTKMVFNRSAAFVAHRVTYFRAENRLLIEKLQLNAPMFVNRLHFRSGYTQPFLAAKIWAFVVDLAIVGMLFWVASGIWMWWEIKPARAWGAACALIGFGAFGLLLATV